MLVDRTLNLLLPELKLALEKGVRTEVKTQIRNIDRTAGTMIAHAVVEKFGSKGLPDDTIHIELAGHAGQSFGAFAVNGMTLDLAGDANDYVGKGLSGGVIIIRAPGEFHGDRTHNIIAGNTTLYGATSGEAYFNGVVGERFAVRLSGASAVVEGTGDHGCEYMTGGRVLILGQTGRNFAAGMSGGIAYVYDLDPNKCNTDLVKLEPLTDDDEKAAVKAMLEKHVHYTDSNLGHILLENWDDTVTHLTKVIPEAYEEMVALIAQAEAEGHTDQEAHMIAFEKKHGKNGKN